MKTATKKQVPTAADRDRMAIMARLFDQLDELMEYLAVRWLDEFEFENIADYQTRIEKEIKARKVSGLKITKMLKRPFGFECTFRGCKYRFTRGMRKYEYVRIA